MGLTAEPGPAVERLPCGPSGRACVASGPVALVGPVLVVSANALVPFKRARRILDAGCEGLRVVEQRFDALTEIGAAVVFGPNCGDVGPAKLGDYASQPSRRGM